MESSNEKVIRFPEATLMGRGNSKAKVTGVSKENAETGEKHKKEKKRNTSAVDTCHRSPAKSRVPTITQELQQETIKRTKKCFEGPQKYVERLLKSKNIVKQERKIRKQKQLKDAKKHTRAFSYFFNNHRKKSGVITQLCKKRGKQSREEAFLPTVSDGPSWARVGG